MQSCSLWLKIVKAEKISHECFWAAKGKEKKVISGLRRVGDQSRSPNIKKSKPKRKERERSMASNFNSWFYLICFFFLAGLATSSFISYDALDVHGGSGRTLLQMKKTCNVSFENLDYSVLTDECKGPQYQAKPCCDAFKKFACPFRDAINDLESDCASTMFSYINLYGKYPPGLFANECREDKNGLDCQNVESKKSGGVQIAATQSSLLILTAGLIGLLFQLF